MAKRTPLTFDNNQLTDDLKVSAGRGVDAFFSSPVPASKPEEDATPPLDRVPASPNVDQGTQGDNEETRKVKKVKPKQPHNRDVMTSRHHATMTPRNHDTTTSEHHEEIAKLRSIVKQIGKEPTTCRLTPEEKNLLRDVEYEFSKRGIATSGNEILRIAMNFLIDDYKQNGEESILDKVLKALNE